MSKTTATLFTEFEKDLLKNMQELEISKPQKEYVLKNINILLLQMTNLQDRYIISLSKRRKMY